MVHSVVLSEKGQLVIPKHLRTKYNLEKGSKLVILEENGKLVLEKSDSVVDKLKTLEAMQQNASQLSNSSEATVLEPQNVMLAKRDAREIT